jgi:dTDP-4-amino-4,6-dideoxygalactose transaminase
MSLDLGRTDEVIVPDFTFPATGNSAHHAGAEPVLVDIDIKTYTIDPAEIEKNITQKTKAIMPVHLFGQCANMKRINEIAEKHRLYVVEDAAGSIGAAHNGKKAGTLGDIACFSFHPRKVLATGEGGMLVTNDDAIADKARVLKNHGIDKKIQSRLCFVEAGYNFRLNDIASALGLVQLRKIESFLRERTELAEKYNQLLASEKLVETPYVASGNNHTYQAYCILIKKGNTRDLLMPRLAARGIETQIGTYALHLQPFYRRSKNTVRSDLSASKTAFENTLALPFYNGLKPEEQEYVSENLSELLHSLD